MSGVPKRLRQWFIVHCIVDLSFAIPLLVYPRFLLWLGFKHVDPFLSRLVAAALFGIGLESYFGRHASRHSFATMLRLKVIFSGTAVVGLVYALVEEQGRPFFAWVVLVLFGFFHYLWFSYWLSLA